jgi:predicted DNA-binding transcriptional regulator AlpA
VEQQIWLTRKELAERLGVAVQTIAAWAVQGTGPRYARFNNGPVRYALADVAAWEQQQMVTTRG